MQGWDREAQQIYAAEGQMEDHGLWFTSVGVARQMTDQILASPWWKDRYGALRSVTIEEAQDGDISWATMVDWNTYVIHLIPRHFAQLFLLHEIAHCANWATWGRFGMHDEAFMVIYLALVRRVIGSSAAQALRAAWKAERVCWAVE